MKTLLASLFALCAGTALGVGAETYLGLVRPLEQTVSFETFPEHVQVRISDGQSCQTPCTLHLRNSQPLTVTVTDEARKALLEKMKKVIPMW